MQSGGLTTIFKAIDVAADLRKLALAFAGVLAIIISGVLFGFLTSLVGSGGVIVYVIVLGLALILLWTLFALFSGALTYMCWQELIHDQQTRVKDALNFSGRNILSFILSPLALLFLGIVVFAAELALLQLGRIPQVGEIIIALLYMPLVLVNILLIVGVAAGSWLVFPIIAESSAGVLQTIQKVITIVRRSPIRMFVIFSLALLVIWIALIMLWFLLGLGTGLTVGLMGVGVGVDVLTDIIDSSFLGPISSPLTAFAETLLDAIGIASPAPPLTLQIASIILAISAMILTVGAVVVFPWVFALAVSCAIYQNLSVSPVPIPAPAAAAPPAIPQPVPGPKQSTGTAAMPQAPSWSPTPGQQPAAYQPPVLAKPDYQQAVAAANCNSCGREIRTNSRFCPFCGTGQH